MNRRYKLQLSQHVRHFKLLLMTQAMCGGLWSNQARAVDPYEHLDPYWVLLHEPAVVAELDLTESEREAYRELLDELDLRFFPIRNKSREVAVEGLTKIVAEARAGMKGILTSSKYRRLNEILMWRLGTAAISQDDVAARLRLDENQRQRLKEITDQTQVSVAALEKEASAGKSRPPLEKKFTELKTSEQRKMLRVLKPEQISAWKNLLGETFEISQLGEPAYKAPELIDTGEWVNSSPLVPDDLRGKVVVIHFYASGCINCIHNYEWYRQWYDKFRGDDFVMIGIHTPETEAERDLAGVRKKATDEKLAFPILLDVKSENWNAWGNSMWPSVYVVDKQGYLRKFWPGELNWQGNEGEKFMRSQIEALLAEETP
ncbi:MAG: redoxin domain-containing protein [Planctomycetaceae bacterium]